MKHMTVLGLVLLGGILLIVGFLPGGVECPRETRYPLKVKKADVNSSGYVKWEPDFGKIPLYFIYNKGQVNEKAKFYARATRYTLWLTKEGMVFDSFKKVEVKSEETDTPLSLNATSDPSRKKNNEFKLKSDISRLIFLNANKNPEIIPIEENKHRVNYFIGNDRSNWRCNIPTSQEVLYKNLYKNIDLKVYGIEKQIEYDWIVKPGGNPGDIQFEYKNVKRTYLDNEGNLLIKTDFGKLMHKRPVAYQYINRQQDARRIVQGANHTTQSEKQTGKNPPDDERTVVNVTFKKIDGNIYGFEVDDYDKRYELIIDPVVLVYSISLDDIGNDHGQGIAVDNSGCVYVTGYRYSTQYPTTDQCRTDQKTYDVFVTKLDTTRHGTSSIIYSTYLGGDSFDYGKDIAVDSSGIVYVTGYTTSTNFPTRDQYQTFQGGVTDAFVTKLSSSGSRLLYSTYLGGSGNENAYGIALDSSGYVYVTGETGSPDFPTRNQYHGKRSSWDAFVTKLDTTKSGASGLLYSTYLGGNLNDSGEDITADASGYAYVVGRTSSTNFPTLNQYQSDKGTWDAFVTKLDTTKSGASCLLYSTYLGGDSNDEGMAIAVDNSGNAYITGYTSSSNFPTLNQYQTYQGGWWDAFVTKINTTKKGASSLIYSTYLGGYESGSSSEDGGCGIALDSSGYAYVTGQAYSTGFPIVNPDQTSGTGFVTKVDPTAAGISSLIYSTYLEGDGYHYGKAIAVDYKGYAYVICTNASVKKLIAYPIAPPTLTTAAVSDATGNSACSGGNIIYDGGAPVTARGVCWKTSPGPTIADNHTSDGIGTGVFTSSITGLTPNTTYYVKAYAANMAGTAYGNEVTFTTSTSGHPIIQLNRTCLNFGLIMGITSPDQTFSVINATSSTLSWTASTNQNWLSCSPHSGTNERNVTVSIDPAGLTAGTHTGTIFVSDPNASNSPQTISVTLNVYAPGSSSPPFGSYDTPTDRSTIRSSVPFTGWVLDDVGVAGVKIYRFNGTTSMYIGEAVLVEGARPDVELAYPDYPNNYKAGWGYMMLTNFLPDGGNGTFQIRAIATDLEGNQVTLGTKTVICDNANAVKPFGAIDTPAQGGPASGRAFVNFGWVLTPLPNTIPFNGSTIYVWVDGVPLGNPVYNQYRQDIADFFPAYNNSDGAVGYFYLDTTPYKNGVHTIQWTATDDGGNSDGIGSRYFMIQNGAVESETETSNFQRPTFKAAPSWIPVDRSGLVRIRKGYDNIDSYDEISADEEGVINIEIKELERFEIHFFEPGHKNSTLKVNQLPIGSTLDAERGIFYWSPGPGFVGEYGFVFISEDHQGHKTRKNVRVIIRSKF